MSNSSAIHEFLREARVSDAAVPHRSAYAAEEGATAKPIPGRNRAKVVVCFIDGEPVEAVVPAPCTVNLDRLLQLADGNVIRLASEEESRRLFPDCEIDTMRPFGALYRLNVFVDAAIALEPATVFNAGTRWDTIELRWTDFVKIVNPIVGRFAEPAHDRVGEYRLSSRE